MRLQTLIMPWAVPVAIAWQSGAVAQARKSGKFKSLREFLYPRPHTVNITGRGKFLSIKGVATVSLLITTEDIDLHVAISQSHLLRDALIDRFTAAGIPGASLNAARCSNEL